MKPESAIACSDNETHASTTRPLRHAQRKSNVNFRCSNCQRRFPSVVRLRRHLNLVHKGASKLLRCSKCSFAFNEVSAFLQHSRIHHQEKAREAVRSYDVSNNKSPQCPTNAISIGNVEPQHDTKLWNKLVDQPVPTNVCERHEELEHAGCALEVKDDAINDLTSKELDALANNTNILSEVVTHEAITVTVTQSDDILPRDTGDHDNNPQKEIPIAIQDDLSSFRKRRQSSHALSNECTTKSLLEGHPTMANIGLSSRALASTAGAISAQQSPVPSVSLAPKTLRRGKDPTFSVGRLRHSQHDLQRKESNYAVSPASDNLHINIPANVQTINLITEARSGSHQNENERSEVVVYLRSVTAKLDAIIRHFNVPFPEQGSTNPTTPFRKLEMQNTRAFNDLELESQPDALSFNLPAHLARKQSSSTPMDCNRANSPVLQRPVDTFDCKPTEDGTIHQDSSFSFNSPASSITRLADQPRFDSDYVLPEDLIRDLHSKSLNRGNFAKHLVFQLFSPDERKGKNCFGRRAGLQSGPKAPLDPLRLQYVRDKVFQYYPCEPGLEETIWRRQCVVAVDTALRGENRPHKKLM